MEFCHIFEKLKGGTTRNHAQFKFDCGYRDLCGGLLISVQIGYFCKWLEQGSCAPKTSKQHEVPGKPKNKRYSTDERSFETYLKESCHNTADWLWEAGEFIFTKHL